ncbi:MAG: T9SS type A sorting domain-containing protein [Cytophagaceae bacterium]
MKVITGIPLVLLTIVSGFSQSFEWAIGTETQLQDKTVKIVSYKDVVYVVKNFKDKLNISDEVIISGYGNTDIAITQMNDAGKVLWAAKAGGIERDEVSDIILDNNGDLIITGNFTGSARFGDYLLHSAGREDIFIARYNQKGKCLWAKSLGGEGSEKGMALTILNNGTITIAGKYNSTFRVERHQLIAGPTSNIFLIWLDRSGIPFNVLTGLCQDENTLPTGLNSDKSGNLYLYGNLQDNLTLQDKVAFADSSLAFMKLPGSFLARIYKEGNVVWLQNIAAANMDSYLFSGSSPAIDEDGNIYITGAISGGAYFGKKKVSGTGLGNQEVFIAKCNPAGIFEWIIINNTPEYSYVKNFGKSIIYDKKSFLYSSGYFNGELILGSHAVKGSGGLFDTDLYIAKLNKKGQVEWIKTAGTPEDKIFNFDDAATSIAPYADNELYVAGTFKGNARFDENSLQSDQKKSAFIAKVGSGSGVKNTRDGYIEETDHPAIYPNPASDQLVIRIGINQDSPIINIITITGETAYDSQKTRYRSNNREITIDITNLKPGIYEVKLIYPEKSELFRLVKI